MRLDRSDSVPERRERQAGSGHRRDPASGVGSRRTSRVGHPGERSWARGFGSHRRASGSGRPGRWRCAARRRAERASPQCARISPARARWRLPTALRGEGWNAQRGRRTGRARGGRESAIRRGCAPTASRACRTLPEEGDDAACGAGPARRGAGVTRRQPTARRALARLRHRGPDWPRCGEWNARARPQCRRPGVGQRSVRVDPFQAMVRQRELFEAGGAHGQGVDRGADVVDKTGQRQFERSRAAADGGRAFVHGDGMTGARQHDGGGQTVGSGTDDRGARACGIGQLRYCRRDAEETAWQQRYGADPDRRRRVGDGRRRMGVRVGTAG